MEREATFGGIIRELLALLGDTRREIALYTLVIGGITTLGILVGLTETTAESLDYGFAVSTNDTPQGGLFELFSTIVSVIATYLLLTRLLAARGRLHTDRNRFWPYLGCLILSVIGVVLGLIVLVVPGILLLVRWSAASGFVIGSGQGVVEALGSSWDATDGHGWAIFFAAVALFFGIALVAGIVGAVAGAVSLEAAGLVSAFIEAASGAVFAALGIAIYNLVHDDAQQISEVFA